MSIAYFVPELADAAVRRRLDMLDAGGQHLTLLGFDRLRPGHRRRPPAGSHVLGRTRNQAFLQRIIALAAALPKTVRLRRLWRAADAIVARNLEMLFLVVAAALCTGARQRIVYECLDLHRLLLDRGPAGVMLRAIERACLTRTSLIVISSPAFEPHFRDSQRYRGHILLAENKVMPGETEPASTAPALGPPWIIAWCGVLRCARSFAALQALAQRRAGRVRIELWGVPALDAIPDFHAVLTDTPEMIYRGPYTGAELPKIYGRAHFAWAIDFYESGGNSEMLLPNRLYESLAFGATPIAVEGVETARWLRRHGVGVVLAGAMENSLLRFIDELEDAGYEEMRRAVINLDPDSIRLSDAACREFAAVIAGAAA